jgi:hypothetical protein
MVAESLIIFNIEGTNYLSFAIKNSRLCTCFSYHFDDFAGFILLREILRDAYTIRNVNRI